MSGICCKNNNSINFNCYWNPFQCEQGFSYFVLWGKGLCPKGMFVESHLLICVHILCVHNFVSLTTLCIEVITCDYHVTCTKLTWSVHAQG